MTLRAGGIGWKKALGGKLATITISGTVTSGGSPAIRSVLVYKAPNNDVTAATVSDSSGDFSIDVNGGSNDCFRIICVGVENENSVIYEHVCS